jgi:hypothetical protein
MTVRKLKAQVNSLELENRDLERLLLYLIPTLVADI